MKSTPEENLLDQALRDVFCNYTLPPAEHTRVWAGVEQRLTTLSTPRTGLPYRLLLPLTALLGVAVGWHLPRPATWQTPPPRVEIAPVAQAGTAPATQSWTAHNAVFPLSTRSAVETVAPEPTGERARVTGRPSQPPHHSAHQSSFNQRPALTAPALGTAVPAVATADTVIKLIPLELPTLEAQSLAAADSLLAETSPAATSPPATEAATSPSPALATHAHSAKPQKLEISTEKLLVYHKPSHRLPERGTGLRRWLSHVVQSFHRILSPHSS